MQVLDENYNGELSFYFLELSEKGKEQYTPYYESFGMKNYSIIAWSEIDKMAESHIEQIKKGFPNHISRIIQANFSDYREYATNLKAKDLKLTLTIFEPKHKIKFISEEDFVNNGFEKVYILTDTQNNKIVPIVMKASRQDSIILAFRLYTDAEFYRINLKNDRLVVKEMNFNLYSDFQYRGYAIDMVVY